MAPERWSGALVRAATNGHVHAVQVLLDAGVNPSIPCTINATGIERLSDSDSPQWLPLCAAAKYGHLDVVALLLSRGTHPDGDYPGSHQYKQRYKKGWFNPSRIPLLAAAQGGHVEVLAAILDAGADPTNDASNRTLLYAGENRRGCSGTLLLEAIQNGHVTTAAILLTDPRVVATIDLPLGDSPLMCAIKKENPEMVHTLLAGGASVEAAEGER